MVESIWEFLNSCPLAPDRPGHTLTGVSEPQALVRRLLSLPETEASEFQKDLACPTADCSGLNCPQAFLMTLGYLRGDPHNQSIRASFLAKHLQFKMHPLQLGST